MVNEATQGPVREISGSFDPVSAPKLVSEKKANLAIYESDLRPE